MLQHSPYEVGCSNIQASSINRTTHTFSSSMDTKKQLLQEQGQPNAQGSRCCRVWGGSAEAFSAFRTRDAQVQRRNIDVMQI